MKTLIALPCMDTVCTPFLNSLLRMRIRGYATFTITQATLIHDARNKLAQEAMAENYDRILFLDSDMTFESDLMERLAADMDEGAELAAGLYFTRKPPITPVIYSECYYKPVEGTKEVIPTATPYKDYPHDSVFEIAACGFGACMVSVDLVKRVTALEGLPFAPKIGFGEDLSFCMRASKVGAKMYCDSRIKCGHVMHTIMDEDAYARMV